MLLIAADRAHPGRLSGCQGETGSAEDSSVMVANSQTPLKCPSFGETSLSSPEQAYPNGPVSGYSTRMSLEFSESFLSPIMLLWMASVVIGAILLFGLMNRRRTKLGDNLREYVEKNNSIAKTNTDPPDDDMPD